MKKYMVTGGCGFIGSTLVNNLLKDNNCSEILVIDDLSAGFEKNIHKDIRIKLIKDKIQNLDAKTINKQYDGIFHLAAQSSVINSITDFYASSTNNLMSTLKVWEIAKEYRTPIVYASSSAIYGNLPIGDDVKDSFEILSPYAQDKLTMEDYAHLCWNLFKIPSIGLRFFNVYGPKQDPSNPYSGVISIFIDRLLNQNDVIVNGGYQTRDFVYVDDTVKVIKQSLKFLNSNHDSFAFNVGTGVSTTIDNLLNMCIKIIGYNPLIINKPLSKEDPERSSGTFEKMQSLLELNLDEFILLENGLINTAKYFKNIL